MNALPPLPPLPWNAAEWGARHVTNLIDREDFVTWAIDWSVAGKAHDAELLDMMHARAKGRAAADAVFPPIEGMYRAAGLLVAAAGGQVGAPAFSFHLRQAFVRHTFSLHPDVKPEPKRLMEWAAYLNKASATSQRSAIIAVSQQLGCPCGGLGVWHPGMINGRARAVNTAVSDIQPVSLPAR